jgi:hypothetical protein
MAIPLITYRSDAFLTVYRMVARGIPRVTVSLHGNSYEPPPAVTPSQGFEGPLSALNNENANLVIIRMK